ncbi:MAG TPA: hypothetical protein VNM22_17175 [Candidatus Limnocylindrales bacterium]|nr:hypothetical protein [Candidatus Limnocylindrales bacterium]
MTIDTVIKIGGSLSAGGNLHPLMQTVATLAHDHNLLVVPGGGGFADTIRYYYRKYRLSEITSHHMAILAMDQFGLLLHDITPHSQAVRTISEARQALAHKQLPILLPSTLLFNLDPLPHSWSVTSDSLAAYITRIIKARRLILIKDVDGILSLDHNLLRTSEEKQILPVLLRSVSISDLHQYKCVDSYFSKALEGISECWILNGNHPERLTQLLEQGQALGTQIRF